MAFIAGEGVRPQRSYVQGQEPDREAPTQGPTPFSFIYHFWQKNTPIIYIVLTNGVPFISLELSALLTAVMHRLS